MSFSDKQYTFSARATATYLSLQRLWQICAFSDSRGLGTADFRRSKFRLVFFLVTNKSVGITQRCLLFTFSIFSRNFKFDWSTTRRTDDFMGVYGNAQLILSKTIFAKNIQQKSVCNEKKNL
jgi:hypothetical protein